MGITISHNAFQGSSQMFNAWRRWLAGKVGIDINQFEGWTDFKAGPLRSISNAVYGTKPWDEFKDDLGILFRHSDSDDTFTPEECARLATRLRAVLDTVRAKGHVGNQHFMVETTEKFITGCRAAAFNNENLVIG